MMMIRYEVGRDINFINSKLLVMNEKLEWEWFEMGRYVVWLKVDGRLVTKEVSAKDSVSAKRKAVKESSWFGGRVEVVSVSAV